MALVLAIDPDHKHEQTLGRLRRELADHHVVIAGSSEEALAFLDQSVPDLVLFPLLLSPSHEQALTSRLRALSGASSVQTLTIPLLASENAENAAPATSQPRWFYWFKPAGGDDAASHVEPGAFAHEVRTYLRPRHQATAAAASMRSPAAGSRHGVSVSGASIGRAALSAARSGARMLSRLVAATWHGARWVGSRELPGGRRLWYATPALVLSAGIMAAVGIPRAKAWLTTEAGLGIADLQSVPPGSEVFVDGNRLGVTPFNAPLPAGKHLVLFRYGTVTKTAALDIAPGQRTEVRVDWQRAPVGRLKVTSDPEGAAITVDGTARGFTPLTLNDLATGQHIVTLRHASGFVRRTVRIKANETASLDASIYSGWLALFAPVELQMTEGGRRLKLDEQSQVMLSPGRHDLQLSNSTLGYSESKIVDVRPGEVTAVTIAIPKTTVSVTAVPSAEVWIDGVRAGETPLADVPVDVGTREFVLKNPALGERRVMTTVTVKPSHINVDFTKPEL